MTTNIDPNISATKNGAPARSEYIVSVTGKDTYVLSMRAAGSYAFTANPTGGTLTLNGTVWTFVSTLTTGNQLLIGTALAITMANAVSTLRASADTNTAEFLYKAGGASINLKASAGGTAGNALTITTTGANATASAATLAGGSVNAPVIDADGPFTQGCRILRQAGPYNNGAWVDFIFPLNNGGNYTRSVEIEYGMKLSTAGYSGDNEA